MKFRHATPVKVIRILCLTLILWIEAGPSLAGTFSTISIQQIILDKIAGRLDVLRATDSPHFRGYTAGDLAGGCLSYGPFFFGNGERQNDMGSIPGYESTATGAGWVGDSSFALVNGMKLRAGAGLAAAYLVTSPRGIFVNSDNSLKAWSIQPLLYASLEGGPQFVDGLMSLAFNRYSSTQNIPGLNTAATAKFNGFQFAAKARVGYIFTLVTLSRMPLATLEFTPLAALQYISLRSPQFQQQGTNITVPGRMFNTAQASFGGKFAVVNVPRGMYTEIHAMMLLDFDRISTQASNNFATFGPAFTLPGNYAKTGGNVGASSTFSFVESVLFTAGLDFEGRSGFIGYTGWLRVRWLF